jgi:hypothetical protein
MMWSTVASAQTLTLQGERFGEQSGDVRSKGTSDNCAPVTRTGAVVRCERPSPQFFQGGNVTTFRMYVNDKLVYLGGQFSTDDYVMLDILFKGTYGKPASVENAYDSSRPAIREEVQTWQFDNAFIRIAMSSDVPRVGTLAAGSNSGVRLMTGFIKVDEQFKNIRLR